MFMTSSCSGKCKSLSEMISRALLILATLVVAGQVSSAQQVNESIPLWQQIRDLKIERADAQRILVNKQIELSLAVVQWQRDQELAQQEVTKHDFELRKYQKGLYPAEQQRLSDEILLAEKKHEQGAIHLEWSEKLANKGLVSQESLQADIEGKTRLQEELDTTKEKLRTLKSITLPRTVLKLEMAVSEAKKSLLELHERLQVVRANFESQIELQQEEVGLLNMSIEKLEKELAQAEVSPNRPLADVQLQQQSLNVKRAQSSLTLATETLRISANSSQLKEQDSIRAVEMAELTLKELESSNGSVDREKLLESQNDVKAKLTFAQQQRNWGKRVLKKGYITSNQLTKFEIEYLEYQTALNTVNRDLFIHDEFTRQQQVVDARTRLLHMTEEKKRVEREIELSVTLAEAEVARCKEVLAAETTALEFLSK